MFIGGTAHKESGFRLISEDDKDGENFAISVLVLSATFINLIFLMPLMVCYMLSLDVGKYIIGVGIAETLFLTWVLFYIPSVSWRIRRKEKKQTAKT